ncbi:MAG: ATP-binding protein [Sulfuritalea sp.]|nr:ATP-binding protein [Sulfuritalea sp.]
MRINTRRSPHGPRQSGKTTLTRALFADKPYVNLERPDMRAFAADDPPAFLRQHANGAVIDEVQNVPELLSYLQVEVDENPTPGRFILTGSRMLEVARGVSQSLAGRIALLKLLPLSLAELAADRALPNADTLIQRGFLPRIHDQGLDPTQALADYFETYVQRDLRELVAVRDLRRFERFVRLCATRTGQLLNQNSLASDAGVSPKTVAAWLSVLEACFIVFTLPPFHAKLGKRLVKSPKLYFYDVGLAAFLLGIESPAHVAAHPLRGALFETLVVTEVLKWRFNRGQVNNLHFYRDSNGNEAQHRGTADAVPWQMIAQWLDSA